MYLNNHIRRTQVEEQIPNSSDIDRRILNVGSGIQLMDGAINLDKANADVDFDLETCAHDAMPFESDYFDELHASHVLEHITNILPLMQELHRVAKQNAIFHIRVPHGASAIAFEDPTHVRQFFQNSWLYFTPMAYKRADYGYRGDWMCVEQVFIVQEEFKQLAQQEPGEARYMVKHGFNVVEEIIVALRAIKPTRPVKDQDDPVNIKLMFRSDFEKKGAHTS